MPHARNATATPRLSYRPAPLGPSVSPRARGMGARLVAAGALLGVALAAYLALAPHPEPAALPDERLASGYGELPLRFEANQGQTDRRVEFLSRGPGYSLFLTPREAVLSLTRGAAPGEPAGVERGAVVRMRLLGANPRPQVTGAERLPGRANYLTGADPNRWRTGVPSFAQVRYANVYPGIDLVYHGKQRSLEYDFVIAPGADPDTIALDFRGVERLAVDARGDLVAHTAAGSLRQERPVLYQRIGGQRRAVSGRYVVKDGNRVGFKVGAYDRGGPLVIDPVLSYATFVGGTGGDSPNGIAVDSAGSAYVTGQTASTDFPTAGPQQAANGGGSDAFVSKLNATGTALVYSTYLGGAGADSALAIAVDATGAYVTGQTASTNFPTASPLQPANGGGATDAFLAKLNPAGSALLYSTYLGGSGADVGRGVAVAAQKPSLTGSTASANFPTASPQQAAIGGGTDAFVARYGMTGAAFEYSTFLGGSGADNGRGIAVAGDNAYVAGDTASANFPTTTPLQAANGGGTDAFVTKLNAAGSARDYSTYLGGGGADNADGVAVLAGSAYVAGDTASTNFPTASPLQAANAGGGDAFVSRLNAAGSALGSSTYLGGAGSDGANAIAVDGFGRASIVGSTSSGDYPVVAPVGAKEGNADMLAAQLNASGSALEYSTPLGGNASESGTAIAVDGAGTAYLTGSSLFFASGDVATAGAGNPFQADNRGGNDALVAKIAAHDSSAPLVTQLGTRSGPTDGGTVVEINGTGFGGVTGVTFGGIPAIAFTVNSPTRITAQSPPRPAGGVPVRVTKPSGTSPPNPVARFTYAEGEWERTGSLVTGRSVHTNTLLENGKVLVAGGRSVTGDSAALTSSELYDPKAGSWSATSGALAGARLGHTATLLRGPECKAASRPAYCGKVLVAAGYTGNSTANAQPVLNTAELFDPATETWSPAGSLNTRRSLHAATPLKDGRVLVAGGRTCNMPPPTQCDFNFTTNTAEVYDPAANTWTTTGPFLLARHTNDAALLPNGKVLVPGGFPGGVADLSAELYTPAANPVNGGWTNCAATTPSPDCPGPLGVARARSGATLLPGGKVIVAAGFPNNDTSELYDPTTGTWSATGKLTTFGRFNFYSALLPNGKFLLTGGGNGGSSAELYDPATERWSSAGVMAEAHGSSSSNANSLKAVVLSSNPDAFAADPAVCGSNCGKVLITGNTELRSAQLYAPERAPVAARPPAAGGAATPPPGSLGPFVGCPATSANVIRGTEGANRLAGTPRGDRIFALGGPDTVDGLSGDDCIDLGAGTDVGRGGAGADLILGGAGADRVGGGAGGDRLRGGAGNDSIQAGAGADNVTGGSGADSITTGAGSDRVSGGSGSDTISTGAGNDTVSARDGKRDRIDCGSGRDRVVADRGDRVARNCERVSRPRG